MNGQTHRQNLDRLPLFKAPDRSVHGPAWLRYFPLRKVNRRKLEVTGS